jgi:hypothetical protein
LQFGTGNRKFFDYLLAAFGVDASQLVDTTDFANRTNTLLNKEFEVVLGEALEQRNEERRKPKCPKGTRDMTPK